MKKEIKFSLVFRDMWQSAGKYVPRVDQLVKVAPAIVEMGCFARVETNGGGFEQVNLLFGENPNKAVRAWTKPFHEAGIQTHMLDRALNGLRMSPVPADVRKLFYKVKKVQGTDITRTFCGLNDARNIAPSIAYAKGSGNDFPVFALYHPFAHPYGGILHQYGVGADQGWVLMKSVSRIWQVSDARYRWARSWQISRLHILKFLFNIIVMQVPVSIWQVSSKFARLVAIILTWAWNRCHGVRDTLTC